MKQIWHFKDTFKWLLFICITNSQDSLYAKALCRRWSNLKSNAPGICIQKECQVYLEYTDEKKKLPLVKLELNAPLTP